MKKLKTSLCFSTVGITVIGFINQLFIVEMKGSSYFFFAPSFVCPIAVCLIGYATWRQCPVKWPSKVWLLVYGVYLLLCTSLLFLNNYAHTLHYPHGYFAPNKLISINSPLPLLLLYFIFTRIRSGKPADERNILP
jgi:hypothetical protein